MSLAEPSTALTDWALAAVSLLLAGHLGRAGGAPGARVRLLWAAGFALGALSATVGGVSHALPLSSALRLALWPITWVTVGAASLCLQAGAAFVLLRGRARPFVLALLGGWFLVWAVLLWQRRTLALVRADTGITLALLVLVAVAAPPARRWLLGFAALTLAGAAVQAGGLSLHRTFDHNDLFHVIEAGALFLLAEAGRRLHDAGTGDEPP